jgi:hypothetical protein
VPLLLKEEYIDLTKITNNVTVENEGLKID